MIATPVHSSCCSGHVPFAPQVPQHNRRSRHCITAKTCTAWSVAAPQGNAGSVASRDCSHQAMHGFGVVNTSTTMRQSQLSSRKSLLPLSSTDRPSCLLEASRIQWGLQAPSSPRRSYRTLAITPADRMATRINSESPMRSSSCHRTPGDSQVTAQPRSKRYISNQSCEHWDCRYLQMRSFHIEICVPKHQESSLSRQCEPHPNRTTICGTGLCVWFKELHSR